MDFNKEFRFCISGFEDEVYVPASAVCEHISAYSKELGLEISALSQNNGLYLMLARPAIGRRQSDGHIATSGSSTIHKERLTDFDPLSMRAIAIAWIEEYKEAHHV